MSCYRHALQLAAMGHHFKSLGTALLFYFLLDGPPLLGAQKTFLW